MEINRLETKFYILQRKNIKKDKDKWGQNHTFQEQQSIKYNLEFNLRSTCIIYIIFFPLRQENKKLQTHIYN